MSTVAYRYSVEELKLTGADHPGTRVVIGSAVVNRREVIEVLVDPVDRNGMRDLGGGVRIQVPAH